MSHTRMLTLIATVAVASTSLAACSGGGSNGSGPASGRGAHGATNVSAGGTLQYQTNTPRETLDPQRDYTAEGIAMEHALFSRGLVAFPTSTGTKSASTPVPDLATTTGTSTDGAKAWSFTLRAGVKWQDGSPVTCADVKYGTARVFATDVITGGPTYMLSYLNIPEITSGPRKGLPIYDGPYKKDGQSSFDKAVTCVGKTITYHFNKSWPDFPLYLAAMGAGDPYKQSQDHGAKSNYQVFSDGPYKLQGAWQQGQGGSFVRNPQWSAKSDPVRKALPNKIVFQEGVTPELGAQQLIADSGTSQDVVTTNNIPPATFSQITGSAAQRAVNVQAPFVEYLIPNMLRLKNPKVRQALAMALDKTSYIQAGGGSKMYDPAYSIVNPNVPGYRKNSAFSTIPAGGDPAAAKKLLQQAGVTLPYPITLTYRTNGPTSDKQFGAIAAAWDQAGFKVTLDGLTSTYWTAIAQPHGTWDVAWSDWAPAWPSMSTELPPLFDSRQNLTPTTTGADNGSYQSKQVNALFDQAAAVTSLQKQIPIYQKAETVLGRDVAYIPLAIQKFYRISGSNVTGPVASPATFMYPDLAGIGVKQ
ncbi:ABC transporter substrate-binding protein [Leekyejoonella antrihumi]|uniref:ABC transporter substrate-binding protein n=1 Tax=Leekyejoonella antrihumi TaxID=1660198 RepID=A0A563DZS5_9MICO|nr:ABC transporter substrate-binding protein [Leekyejoonella antrihumi]TWP35778.1 ABC transporter substrate-binding protein [Leekyejoonella antrihumi]